MGMQLGYTMMTEQAGPKDLVSHVVGAEEAGFDFAVSSDHYFPWLDEMGHSPHAWTTLGAAAQATSRIPLMTYVTCRASGTTRRSWRSRRRPCRSSPTAGSPSAWAR